MHKLTMKDGTALYYKDWGSGQPVVFSHGWHLSSDAWEAEMMLLAAQGNRSFGNHSRALRRSSHDWHGTDKETSAHSPPALSSEERRIGTEVYRQISVRW